MQFDYFAPEGHGLTKVGPAVGFHSRDVEPSGLLSQLRCLEAISTDSDAGVAGATRRGKRILAYNEDDVRATAAVLAGLRSRVFDGPAS